MPLPTLVIPDYECKMPISGQKVTYRPFLVKEEKLLYLAMETQNEKEMFKAVKTILKACTNLRTVDNLATFEIEFLFLKIRSKAVGDVSEFKVTCQDDGETQVDVSINLEEVEVVVPKEHKKIIKLNETVKVEMKYPALESFVDRNMKDEPDIDDVFDLAASCIKKVYEGEETYDSFTKQEAKDFLGQMNNEQFGMIQTFFDTMPKLVYEFDVENPNTKVVNTVTLEGLASFFA